MHKHHQIQNMVCAYVSLYTIKYSDLLSVWEWVKSWNLFQLVPQQYQLLVKKYWGSKCNFTASTETAKTFQLKWRPHRLADLKSIESFCVWLEWGWRLSHKNVSVCSNWLFDCWKCKFRTLLLCYVMYIIKDISFMKLPKYRLYICIATQYPPFFKCAPQINIYLGLFHQCIVQITNTLLRWLHTDQKCFPAFLFLLFLSPTDAQKPHNPWGRPGLCRQGITQVWGIMTPLISLRLFAEAPLGPCQFQALQFGWIYQWRSLPHYYMLFLISLSLPYALSELIIPHCENHKKGESYLIFTWGHFLEGEWLTFFSLFF